MTHHIATLYKKRARLFIVYPEGQEAHVGSRYNMPHITLMTSLHSNDSLQPLNSLKECYYDTVLKQKLEDNIWIWQWRIIVNPQTLEVYVWLVGTTNRVWEDSALPYDLILVKITSFWSGVKGGGGLESGQVLWMCWWGSFAEWGSKASRLTLSLLWEHGQGCAGLEHIKRS